MLKVIPLGVALLLLTTAVHAQSFDSFYKAKKYLTRQITPHDTTIYCSCEIKKQGKKLTPDPAGCGYQPRKPVTRNGKPNVRATRIEWEHIVPAWEFGHQLQCWQNGGRKNCRKISAKFRQMEADIHNLAPAIGEINADRSNFRFGLLPHTPYQHGACDVKIDFKQRIIEPPYYARKQIAQAYFYMHKTYGLKLSKRQRRLFSLWAE
ncbi:endonuclease [Pseudoalteromonas luteoviolacea]|uniref:Endonuclease I n=1 Tax=Pseudoalteromonas luteoviolacea NCIMB 1942 TaxID=1365253 RepID=A0A167BUG4_9GAMM|nr:endonuclease [Pseudoalteromonas luteoviolacea]KZN46914.1 hypothetical protein N482_10910 [Pseudoalteromonas luteoviolacea NCIMB 1942]KZX02265.1 endonuclease I [Pseudoalteromonas luteoviolacea]